MGGNIFISVFDCDTINIVLLFFLLCIDHCYACKNQGMDDLKHPVIGAYERGSPDMVFPYMYVDSSDDEFAPVKLDDEADEEYIFPDELR